MDVLKPGFADSSSLSFDPLPPEPSWSLDTVTVSESNKWTHGYHRYPSRTLPQLVERLLDLHLKRPFCHVNDPFMGSGTTAVAAVSKCHYVSGTDINPLSALVSNVKAVPLDPEHLNEHVVSFFTKISYLGLDESALLKDYTVPLMPNHNQDRIDYWFQEEAKVTLGKILRHIHAERDLEFRSFLQVAFSHILKTCSLWSRSSVRPLRKPQRNPMNPLKALSGHLRQMMQGNELYWRDSPDEVRRNPERFLDIHTGDSRKQRIEDASMDFIIADCPHVATDEYADLHQLSLLWLSLVDDFEAHRAEYIGSRLRTVEDIDLPSPVARGLVEEMQTVSDSTASRLQAFYVDMEKAFVESRRLLKPGGKACFIIRNTRLRGLLMRNAEVFAQLLQLSGLEVESVIKRLLPGRVAHQVRDSRTGKFMASPLGEHSKRFEYILVARKPGC